MRHLGRPVAAKHAKARKCNKTGERGDWFVKVARVTSPLGILIRRALALRGVTMSAFAEEMQTSPGFVGDIIAGRRTLHPDKWAAWGRGLGLRGWRLRRFELLAGIQHVPESGRQRMLKAVYRLDYLEDLVASPADVEPAR